MEIVHNTRFKRAKIAGQEPYAGYVIDPLKPKDKDGNPNYKKDKDGKLIPLDPGLTKQEMAEDTNVNRIMARYEPGLATRLLNSPAVGGDYGNFASVKDFQKSLETVMEAEAAFEVLPAQIRARFDNDPVKMLAFVHNPANREEMYNLGLAIRPAAEPPGNAVPAPEQGVKNAPSGAVPPKGDKA